jgi:Ca2+-transporting ATPase
VIVLGQILIVSFAGKMFNVSPLQAQDWLWIMLITSPVLFVADIVRTVRNLLR